MRFKILSFLLILVSPTAWTEQSESDRYCEHLSYLRDRAASEAPVPRMQMSDPEEILRIYYDNLSSRFFVSYSEAMENNQTFEEFRANAMKLGLELKPQLKSSFISDLIAKHCGSAVYGERLRVLPNGMLHIHSGMIFSKQFDPRGHAYYDGGMAATQ